MNRHCGLFVETRRKDRPKLISRSVPTSRSDRRRNRGPASPQTRAKSETRPLARLNNGERYGDRELRDDLNSVQWRKVRDKISGVQNRALINRADFDYEAVNGRALPGAIKGN